MLFRLVCSLFPGETTESLCVVFAYSMSFDIYTTTSIHFNNFDSVLFGIYVAPVVAVESAMTNVCTCINMCSVA